MKKTKKNLLIIFVIILLLFIGTNIALSIMVDQVNHISVNMPALSDISDGNYIGEYSVKPVYVKVEVTIKENKISDIEILKHMNGLGSAAEEIVNVIVDKQSLDADAISGATVSSKCILKAVENALE